MNNYITSINIINVRHLRGIKIPLGDGELKHLILTGKNGAGKTSVAEEIESFFSGKKTTGDSRKIMIDFPFGNAHSLFHANQFIFRFFGASRKLKPKPLNLARPTLDVEKDKKITQSERLLDFIFSLNYEKLELQSKGDIGSKAYIGIQKWFEAWEKTLKEVFEDSALKFDFDIKKKKYWIRQGEKQFDLTTLSDGYSSILAIIAELILVMGQNKNEVYDIPGIVIIDEIDIHLHLSLQKLILPMLTRFFPKIQFIATTHSPFVLTSIDNAVIYDLEHNILINESIKGASYEAVVESFFKVDEFNDEVKEKMKRYRELVSNGALAEHVNEILSLKTELEDKTKIPWLSKLLAGEFAELEIVRRKKMGV